VRAPSACRRALPPSLARLGQEDGVVEPGLGDIIAPGHAGLQFARVARQQHGEAERGGFERAGRRAFGRAIVGEDALARCAVLHAFAAAQRFHLLLSDFLLGGFGAVDCGEAARGAGDAARAEKAGQVPVRRVRSRQDFASEVGVEIGMRPDEIAAQEVDEALAHGDGRGRLRQSRHAVGGRCNLLGQRFGNGHRVLKSLSLNELSSVSVQGK
jgi:hypothetical protein